VYVNAVAGVLSSTLGAPSVVGASGVVSVSLLSPFSSSLLAAWRRSGGVKDLLIVPGDGRSHNPEGEKLRLEGEGEGGGATGVWLGETF